MFEFCLFRAKPIEQSFTGKDAPHTLPRFLPYSPHNLGNLHHCGPELGFPWRTYYLVRRDWDQAEIWKFVRLQRYRRNQPEYHNSFCGRRPDAKMSLRIKSSVVFRFSPTKTRSRRGELNISNRGETKSEGQAKAWQGTRNPETFECTQHVSHAFHGKGGTRADTCFSVGTPKMRDQILQEWRNIANIPWSRVSTFVAHIVFSYRAETMLWRACS